MNLSNKEINDYYEQAVEDFKDSHPDIHKRKCIKSDA